jgi:integrase
MESMLLDAAGHRRSPATMPGYHRGRPPGNKGEQYPADPPTVEEIVAVMRAIGDRAEGQRLRALIVLLWRAGLRISEALALQECDLDRSRGAVIVRRGKAASGERLGRTAGHGSSSVRGWRFVAGSRSARCCALSTDRPPDAGGRRRLPAKQLHHAASVAGVRRRFAPHQLRHAHAVEMAHEGVPLVVIQRQLGHANLGITSIYLQGIDSSEIISAVHGRPSPTISATAGLQMTR